MSSWFWMGCYINVIISEFNIVFVGGKSQREKKAYKREREVNDMFFTRYCEKDIRVN